MDEQIVARKCISCENSVTGRGKSCENCHRKKWSSKKTKQCVECLKEFFPLGSTSKYCGKGCRLKAAAATMRRIRESRRTGVDRRKNPTHKLKVCGVCATEYTPTSSRQRICKKCRDLKKLKTVACEDCGVVFKQNCGTHKLCKSCQKTRKNKACNRMYHEKMSLLDESQKGYKEKVCRDCGSAFKPNGATQKMCKACSSEAAKRWNKSKGKLEKHKKKQKEWRQKNIQKIRRWRKGKYDSDLSYRLACNYRSVMRDAFSRRGVAKDCKFSDAIGISKDGFVAYLTSHQNALQGGFTVDNYGAAWEVDHIRPIASFDLTDESQVRQAFHYTNCQPLAVSENRNKSAKYKGTLWRLGKPVDGGLVSA